MKRKILYSILAILTGLFSNSCTEQFKTINVDPSVVTEVDVRFLFTSSIEALETYRSGGEIIFEDFDHFLTTTQLITTQSYEVNAAVNVRYSCFYSKVLPNLFEMKRIIDNKTDKEKYQQIYAITYVVQALMGLKVTDLDGSIPYTEANQGRYLGKYDPVYDNQKTLYDTWVKELSASIKTLESNLTDQVSFGNNDIYFHGDITKWIKLANTIKLRIAARYQNNDAAAATQIFKEVMADAVGPMSSNDDQMTYQNANWFPLGIVGYDVDIQARHFAVETVVDFMKASGDPRLGIYHDKNGLVGSFKDTLTKYNLTLPSWCNLNDPNIMYQGGSADFALATPKRLYFDTPFNGGGSNRYPLISNFNRRFWAPTVDGGTGQILDVMVSYAEVCLHIAEFIQKGYGTGFDTKGTAAQWYNKGVRSSVQTMNSIATVAKSTSFGNVDPLVDTFLTNPKVALDGNNNLEKIYIQELLNFYKSANEAFTLVRRTGYPKFNSTLLPREVVADVRPRRWWLFDPGAINHKNWAAAITEQGFTPNAFTEAILHSERLWFDKNSPDYGMGN